MYEFDLADIDVLEQTEAGVMAPSRTLVCFSAALIRMSKSSFLLIELASGGSSADFTSK